MEDENGLKRLEEHLLARLWVARAGLADLHELGAARRVRVRLEWCVLDRAAQRVWSLVTRTYVQMERRRTGPEC